MISVAVFPNGSESTGNAYIGHCHAVLDPILFRGFHADKLEAVSRDFAELPEIFRRDKGTADEVKFEKVSNPFGVLFIGLFTFDCFDIFRMGETNMDVMFQVIKNRNPILTSGFHTHMLTVIFN